MAKDPIKTLENLEKRLNKNVAGILNDCAERIQSRVNSDEFLKWKTRRRPIIVEKAKLKGNIMIAGVRGASGWKYADVFIGPAGTSVTVRPKNHRFLAIPTDAARKEFRTRRLGAEHYSGTVIFDGIIWGKAGWGTGSIDRGYLRQRRAAGEVFRKEKFVPLFILKGSVVVARRIHPLQLVEWIKPYFDKQLKAKALTAI